MASFAGGSQGKFTGGELTKGADGALYGVLSSEGSQGCGTIYKVRPSEGITVVHDFGDGTEGCGPVGKLLVGSDGHFYGTAVRGGAKERGVVYRFDPDGSYAVVASFEGWNGSWPLGELLEAKDGLMYGTSYDGGQYAKGTIFSVSRDGQIQLLHSFNDRDGRNPFGQLVQLADESLMGVTWSGGLPGYGVIFRNDRHGGHTILHDFTASKDGAYPRAGMTFGADGKLYGSATTAGRNDVGVLYRIDPDGSNFEVVHHCREATGSGPLGRLVLANDGKLLGTMSIGGRPDGGGGVAFSIDPAGDYRALIRLDGSADGSWPGEGLTDNGDGLFYGLTGRGGQYGRGTVFRFAYP